MGLLGGIVREGSWWVSSKKDPRWNTQGRGFVGGLLCPPDAESFLEEKKKELNCEPPDDLEFGYMKD